MPVYCTLSQAAITLRVFIKAKIFLFIFHCVLLTINGMTSNWSLFKCKEGRGAKSEEDALFIYNICFLKSLKLHCCYLEGSSRSSSGEDHCHISLCGGSAVKEVASSYFEFFYQGEHIFIHIFGHVRNNDQIVWWKFSSFLFFKENVEFKQYLNK